MELQSGSTARCENVFHEKTGRVIEDLFRKLYAVLNLTVFLSYANACFFSRAGMGNIFHKGPVWLHLLFQPRAHSLLIRYD